MSTGNSGAPPLDTGDVMRAMRRAAIRARDEAIRANTGLAVWRGGRSVVLSPHDEEILEKVRELREADASEPTTQE